MSIIFKNDCITHSVIPLCITNAFYISYILLFKFNKFKKEYLKNKKVDMLNKNIYTIILCIILVHFIIPFYIIYNNKHKERKKHSDIILSLLVSSIILFIYSFYYNKNTYSKVNLHDKDMIYIIPTYLLLLFVITIIYFL